MTSMDARADAPPLLPPRSPSRDAHCHARFRPRHGSRRSATTHTDLALRALDMGIEVRVIHNASIMNAVASCGLQLYNFGQTITVPFWTEKWQPDSFFEKILHNSRGGLHTLCLLGEPVGCTACCCPKLLAIAIRHRDSDPQSGPRSPATIAPNLHPPPPPSPPLLR